MKIKREGERSDFVRAHADQKRRWSRDSSGERFCGFSLEKKLKILSHGIKLTHYCCNRHKQLFHHAFFLLFFPFFLFFLWAFYACFFFIKIILKSFSTNMEIEFSIVLIAMPGGSNLITTPSVP